MALFTAHNLIALLKKIGKEFGYKVDNDTDYAIEENTATISYLGNNDKLFLSVVVLYGGIYTKINIFDQNDQNIFSKSVKEANFDKNEYQDAINKVQEELKKYLDHVPKKLYKVKTICQDDLEVEINRMAAEGWELYTVAVSDLSKNDEDFYISEYKLVFKRKEK